MVCSTTRSEVLAKLSQSGLRLQNSPGSVAFARVVKAQRTTRQAFSQSLFKETLMSQPLPSPHAVPATPLGRALDQNVSVKDAVEQSSAELAVINAVLNQELPGDIKKGDVGQALQKTDALEHKIQDAADDLAEVNEVLAHEIDQRADLERELAATKAALACEKAKP
jgi:hypothetical protein